MNTEDGALHFESSFGNEKFIAAIDEAKRRIMGFSDSAISAGENIDEAFKIATQKIIAQKEVVADLESQIKTLNQQITVKAPGSGQEELKKQLQVVTGQLTDQRQALKELESEASILSSKMSGAFQASTDKIANQKNVIAGLQSELINLNQQLSKSTPGLSQDDLKKQISSVTTQLVAAKTALKEFQDQGKAAGTISMSVGSKQLDASIDETKKKIQGLGEQTKKSQSGISEMFDVTNENIKIQKQVIVDLENKLKELDSIKDKLPVGKALSDLNAQTAEVRAEITAEKNALKELEGQVNQTGEAHVGFRTRLRQMKEALIEMEEAGLRGTAQYAEMQKQFAHLTDAMSDAQAQGKFLGDDQRMFKGLISGMTGIAGAASAAQGAMGLFAGENENLQRAMLKVQSLMGITIGLQQISETLDKDQAFMLVIVGKAKEYLAIATNKLSAALGVSTLAAQAFMAALTLGLSVAITAAIVVISRLVEKSAEAKKQMEAFNKSVVDSAYKPLSDFEKLRVLYESFGNDLKAKQKFVDDNADSFEKLGVKIGSVTDADNLFIKNKDAFIDSIMERAKSVAWMEIASEKYKKALAELMKAEELPDKIKKVETSAAGGSTFSPGAAYLGAVDVDNTGKQKKIDEAQKAITAVGEIVRKSIEAEDKAVSDLTSAGIDAVTKNKGIDEAAKKLKEIQNAIALAGKEGMERDLLALKQQYDSDAEAYKNNEQIKTALAQKYAIDRNEIIKKYKDKDTVDVFSKDLQSQLDEASTVMEKLNIIAQKKREIANQDTPVAKAETIILDKADESTQKDLRKQTEQLLTDYSSYLSKKVALDKQYFDDQALLWQKFLTASNAAERAAALGAIAARRSKYEKDLKSGGDTDYGALLENYQNYEQKKQAIIDDFDEKRKVAARHNDKELIAELNKAQDKALSGLAADDLIKSPDWTKVFNDLDKISTRELLNLKEKLESQFNNLNLLPEDLKTLRDKIGEITKIVEQRNPFLALGDALKKYKKTQDSTDLKDVFKAIAGSVDLVKGAFDSVVGSLDKLGIKTDEGQKQVLSDISGMMGGASSLAMGIATGNPLQIIQGSIDLLSNGIDLIAGAKDRKLERSIQDLKKQVDNLTQSYDFLDFAIKRAVGQDIYTDKKAQLDNLKKQYSDITLMMNDESNKKKSDPAKVAEYQNQQYELYKKQQDLINGMRDDILGSSVKDAADALGNAFIDAFAKGEDAAAAWGNKVQDIVSQIARKMLIQKLIEGPIQSIIDKYSNSWVDDQGNFAGFDAVLKGLPDMSKELTVLGAGFSDMFANLPDDVKNLLFGNSASTSSSDSNSMTGAIKGVTEQTAGVLEGQINAMRISQADTNQIVRQQLLSLSEIAANTRYNIHLESIDATLKDMKTASLRAQGLN